MRIVDVVIGRVRVGPRDDDHAEIPTALDQLAERVAVAEPPAALVEGDLGRIVGDAAAGAETRRVAVGPAEVVEPEPQVELARVVLDESELGPAQRAVDPARRIGERRRSEPGTHLPGRDHGPRHAAGPEERSTREVVLHAR
jgi:hypothetical protein